MGNLHFAVLATPDKHEDIKREINNWKYQVEGEVAKGEMAPAIAELKLYEVRIPDKIEAEFVRDMRLVQNHRRFGTTNSPLMTFVYMIFRFVMMFTPYRKMDESKMQEKPKYSFAGTWHYAFPIGKLKRKKMKVKFGKDREVL